MHLAAAAGKLTYLEISFYQTVVDNVCLICLCFGVCVGGSLIIYTKKLSLQEKLVRASLMLQRRRGSGSSAPCILLLTW